MSRKTVIAIIGRIVTAAVISALPWGAWWLWRRLRTGPAVDWRPSSKLYCAGLAIRAGHGDPFPPSLIGVTNFDFYLR
jgi:hypothetical protein